MFVTNTSAVSGDRMRRLDRYLAAATAELFGHDRRLAGCAIEVRFDRGVAHLTGSAEPDQVRLVRDLIGRLDGVLAVWSRVRVGGRPPVLLDIGAGGTKQYPENIGVDIYPAGAVDVLADLRDGLPFQDRSVDVIFAVHVLEHLIDFLPLVRECHRVLRPGGVLHVLSPWWRYVNAVADPTHVRLIDVQTVKGICERPWEGIRWYPLHASCDGATVFADLTPLDVTDPAPPDEHLARFFD